MELKEVFSRSVRQYAEREGVTEQMKADERYRRASDTLLQAAFTNEYRIP